MVKTSERKHQEMDSCGGNEDDMSPNDSSSGLGFDRKSRLRTRMSIKQPLSKTVALELMGNTSLYKLAQPPPPPSQFPVGRLVAASSGSTAAAAAATPDVYVETAEEKVKTEAAFDNSQSVDELNEDDDEYMNGGGGQPYEGGYGSQHDPIEMDNDYDNYDSYDASGAYVGAGGNGNGNGNGGDDQLINGNTLNHTFNYFADVTSTTTSGEVKTVWQCLECKKQSIFKTFSKNTGKTNLDMHLENCHKIVTRKRKRVNHLQLKYTKISQNNNNNNTNGAHNHHHQHQPDSNENSRHETSTTTTTTPTSPQLTTKPPSTTTTSGLNELDRHLVLLNVETLFHMPHESASFLAENVSFRRFASLLNKNYDMPSRDNLVSLVRLFYDEKASEVRASLARATALAVSLEQWTVDYVAVNVHYVDHNESSLAVRSCCLAVRRIRGEWRMSMLEGVLAQFGVVGLGKVVAVVANRRNLLAATMAVRCRYVCVGSLFEEAVGGVLTKLESGGGGVGDERMVELASAVHKCGRLAREVGESAELMRELVAEQPDADNACLRFEQTASRQSNTSWHATYTTLKRVHDAHPVLSTLLQRHHSSPLQPPPPLLSPAELTALAQLLDLLDHFHQILDVLNANAASPSSNSTYAPASLILPSLKHLDKCLGERSADTPLTQALKSTLKQPLLAYMAEFNNPSTDHHDLCLLAAAYLDPFYKDLKFVDKLGRPGCLKRIRRHLVQTLTAHEALFNSSDANNGAETTTPHIDVSPRPVKSAKANVSYTKKIVFEDSDEEDSDEDDDELGGGRSVRRSLKSEMRQYGVDEADGQNDALAFWRMKKAQYPLLAGLATRLFLAMPATCVPTRALFAESGERRRRHHELLGLVEAKCGSGGKAADFDKFVFIYQNRHLF